MQLYHASQITNLSKIVPQPTLSHDKYIGDYVFATANFKLALMYLVPKGIGILMNVKANKPNIVIASNVKILQSKDRGGAIYILSDEKFEKSPQQEIGEYEMVCKSEVKPIDKILYKSVLNALTSNQIEVRFVSKSLFNELINNPKQDQIIKTIKPYQPK